MKKRKKKIMHLLLCLVLLFGLFSSFGGTASADSPLPGFAGSGGQISWKPVAGADNYHLQGMENLGYLALSNNGYTFSGCFNWTSSGISFNVLKYMDIIGKYEEKTYNLTVKAYKGTQELGYSSTYQYAYKSKIPQLETPKNLRWNGSSISWDPVSGIDYYWVGVYRTTSSSKIWEDHVKTAGADLTATSWYTEDPPVPFQSDGQYYFKVRALQYEYQKTARDSMIVQSETVTGNMVMSGYKTGDKFKITVTNGTANKTSAKYGEKVTVTADEKSGYDFDYWYVGTGGVNLGNTAKATISFNMPDRNVVLIANYKKKQTADKVALMLTKPVEGEKPAADLFCAGAELKKLTWYRKVPTERGIEDWEEMPSTAKFAAGKRYMANIELSSPAGCVFASADELMVTLNGEKLGGAMAALTDTSMTIRKEYTAEALNPFTDVTSDKFFYQPVIWAARHKPVQITAGTSADKFSPDQNCTRAQIVTFLWRLERQPEPGVSTCKFKDIKTSEYYYKAVLWAVEKGITEGKDGEHFDPDGNCTRGEVVTFLWRYEKKPKPASSANPFKDVPGSAYYYQPVLWAAGAGVTSGTDAGIFSPDKTCTRGEIVTFLYRDKGGK